MNESSARTLPLWDNLQHALVESLLLPQRALPFVFACCLLLAIACSQAASASSPVWQIQGEEGGFLLGGTIHMLRPQDFPLPEVFDLAYDVTETVVLEADLGALVQPEIQRLMFEQGFQPEGRTLADEVTADTWARLVELTAELGIPEDVLARMRPSFAGLTVARALLGRLGVTEVGIDGYFYRRARADGRALRPLEDAREQMEMLLGLGADDPDRFLDANLDDLERSREVIEAAISDWRSGDFDALHANLIEPSREQDPRSHRLLFTERNAAWMVSLEMFAVSDERELVLVGAGHLGGPDGLLEALRAAGYQVRPWRGDR